MDFQAELLAGRMQNARGPRTGPIDFREPSRRESERERRVGERERERDRRQFRVSLRPPQVFEKGHPVIWIYGTLLCARSPSRPIARSAYFVYHARCVRSPRVWNMRTRYFVMVALSRFRSAKSFFRQQRKALKNYWIYLIEQTTYSY